MKIEIMSPERLAAALAIPDLTDPKNGLHAINLAMDKIHLCLSAKTGWPTPEIRRSGPVTTVAKNFDQLRFPADNPGRSSRYTRYVSESSILRTHTSEMITGLLDELKGKTPGDYLVMCPGICYRRDVVDRNHCGEPHQLDIWRVKSGLPRLDRPALIELIETLIACVFPGTRYRANEVNHPYTIHGLEVEILKPDGQWLELLECGEAHPEILAGSGLDPREYSGLAMGIGLDRLVMLIKGLDDIRLLRSNDPRVKRQMGNLDPYQPVSKHPSVRQDLSVSVAAETSEEDVCETIRDALGEDANIIETITIVSDTAYENLPPKAIERLGISPGQKNLLVRVILRSPEKSLTHKEANRKRDLMYRAVDKSRTGGYLSAT